MDKKIDAEKEFKLVLLGMLVVVLTYIFTIYFFTMKARLGVFRRTFLSQFDEMHAKEIKGQD